MTLASYFRSGCFKAGTVTVVDDTWISFDSVTVVVEFQTKGVGMAGVATLLVLMNSEDFSAFN